MDKITTWQASAHEIDICLPNGYSLNKMLVEQGGVSIHNFLDNEIKKKTCNSENEKRQGLIIHNDQKISLETDQLIFEVLGHIPLDFGELSISLHISNKSGLWKYRQKIDLYDYQKIIELCNYMHEQYELNPGILEKDMLLLIQQLEIHRDKLYNNMKKNTNDQEKLSELSPIKERIAVDFLQNTDLLERINSIIGQTGIVGEEKVRMAVFIIASSYKMPYPLHGIIQGVSGGGKSHLINSIASTMPQEDVLDMTRITPKSLYNYSEYDLMHKVFIIQDFDGVDPEAQMAFRELQSLGYINSLYTKKDRFGNHLASHRKVKAHFSSLIATTHSDLYYDTLSRSLVLGIDESQEQTDRIIEAQNSQMTGRTNESEQETSSLFLRNVIRVLQPYKVVNPFAHYIKLPIESRMKRRLNQQFQYFVAQITLLHQFQRKFDEQNRLVATLEDVNLALKYFIAPVLLKVDELDSSSRQFFENLKAYVRRKGLKQKFTQREVRLALNLAKTRVAWYLKQLLELEYIEIVEGSANRGFKYRISYWDDLEKFKRNMQENLNSQLKSCSE